MQVPAHLINNSFTRTGAAPTLPPPATAVRHAPVTQVPIVTAAPGTNPGYSNTNSGVSTAAPGSISLPPNPTAGMSPLDAQLFNLANGRQQMNAAQWAALLRQTPTYEVELGTPDPTELSQLASGSGPNESMSQFLASRHLSGLRGRRGMGAITSSQASSLISSAASMTSGSIVAATAATTAGMATGIGAAVVGLVGVAMAIYKLTQGCGAECTESTTIANEVGDQMSTAFQQYMSAPVHYQSVQTTYLALFDNAWAQLVQLCSNPALGSPGERCITDRQAGACTWTCSPFGWQQNSDGSWTYIPAGPVGSGSTCWNYFSGMRDPVANDPTVVPDPPTDEVSTAVSSLAASTSSGTTDYTPVVIAAVLILAAVLL
jgi:hypothetical protein